MSLSPCSTCTSTRVWLSATVVKTRLLRVGIVLLRSMSGVNVPSLVSMPERVRRDVEQHQVLDLALDDAGLDGGAHRDALVGVDRAVRLLAEDLAHDLRHLRRAGLAADEQHLVDLLRLHLRVGQAALAGLDRLLEQIVGQLLVLLPGEHGVEVLGPRGVGRDEGQDDLGLLRRWRARTSPSRPPP